MASLKPYCANCAIGQVLGALHTHLLWGAAHVYFLIGFKNRLFVVLNWLWAYVTWQRGVRLIMHREEQGKAE